MSVQQRLQLRVQSLRETVKKVNKKTRLDWNERNSHDKKTQHKEAVYFIAHDCIIYIHTHTHTHTHTRARARAHILIHTEKREKEKSKGRQRKKMKKDNRERK